MRADRRLLGLPSILLLLSCLAVAVCQPAFAGYKFPVSTGSYACWPAVSGNIVVWEDWRNWNGDIYGKDISTGREFPVCIRPGDQIMPAISGKTVVWGENRSGEWQAYGKDISTGREFRVCSFIFRPPSVAGDTVVWTQRREYESDIFGKSISTGREFAICTNGFAYGPAISGNIVVWIQYTGVDGIIRGKDLVTGQEFWFWVCGNPTDEGLAISGSRVVWLEHRHADWHLNSRDLTAEFALPVCAMPSSIGEFDISGNTVVWVDFRDGDRHVYGKDLNTGLAFPVCPGYGEQDRPAISGETVVWEESEDWLHDSDIYACRLDPTDMPPGFAIGSLDLTPGTLHSSGNVIATLSAGGAARAEMRILGLNRDWSAIPMSWNGSAWIATVPGSLVRWAQGNSLQIRATVYHATGCALSIERALPVSQSCVYVPAPTPPNAISVNEDKSFGIVKGSAHILPGEPPLRARLSVDTVMQSLLGVDGPMNLWPHVEISGVPVSPANELAHINYCSPSGGPAYDASFANVGDSVAFTLGMWDKHSVGLLWADTIMSSVAALVGMPNFSPASIMSAYNALSHLAPFAKAMREFSPMPAPSQFPAAVARASWDLSEFFRNGWERDALKCVIQEAIREARGDPTYKLSNAEWIKKMGNVLSAYQLSKICRDVWVWALSTWGGDPRIVFTAYRTGEGTPAVSTEADAGSSALMRAGEAASFDVTDAEGQSNYVFTLTNTEGAPIWEWRLEFDPDQPMPIPISAPAGWECELNWDILDRSIRWHTQGPNGWATGDYGTATVAQGGSLSGFTFTTPSRLDHCSFSVTDAEMRAGGGLVPMKPELLATPARFVAKVCETTTLLASLDRPAVASIRILHDGAEYVTIAHSVSKPAGQFEAGWDGKDASGELAPPGDYEARLDVTYAGGDSASATTDVTVNDSITISSLAEVRSLQQGTLVTMGGKIATTEIFGEPQRVYVEEPDRTAGILVQTSEPISRGDVLDITGKVARADGELAIAEAEVTTVQENGPVPPPLGMNNATVGGGDSGYDSVADIGQPGVDGGIGVNNVGLLVRTWGRVTQVEPVDEPATPTWFEIDDGNRTPVRCLLPTGIALDPQWDYVTVTGISTCQVVDDELRRAIYLRDAADLVAASATLSSLAAVRSLKPGTRVSVAGEVATTETFGDPERVYVEETDRTAGIRVQTSEQVSRGDVLDIIGDVGKVGGELAIVDAEVTAVLTDGDVPPPLGMANTALGGGDSGYDPFTNAGQQGVIGGTGLSNIGLLVRTWGQITEVEPVTELAVPTWFKIDDGSGVAVKCMLPTGATVDPLWGYVTVTGVSSCEAAADGLHRCIYLRDTQDIVQH